MLWNGKCQWLVAYQNNQHTFMWSASMYTWINTSLKSPKFVLFLYLVYAMMSDVFPGQLDSQCRNCWIRSQGKTIRLDTEYSNLQSICEFQLLTLLRYTNYIQVGYGCLCEAYHHSAVKPSDLLTGVVGAGSSRPLSGLVTSLGIQTDDSRIDMELVINLGLDLPVCDLPTSV